MVSSAHQTPSHSQDGCPKQEGRGRRGKRKETAQPHHIQAPRADEATLGTQDKRNQQQHSSQGAWGAHPQVSLHHSSRCSPRSRSGDGALITVASLLQGPLSLKLCPRNSVPITAGTCPITTNLPLQQPLAEHSKCLQHP